ncbi:multiprotein-bridging factor 1 family protein [Elusimicrobiota bacterium]
MKKTSDALEILHRRIEKNPHLKRMYEEERVNLQASIEIREAREKAGLTQAQLAKLIKTTQSVIARLEDADYRGHTLKMLERIATALNRHVEIHLAPRSSRGHHASTHYQQPGA